MGTECHIDYMYISTLIQGYIAFEGHESTRVRLDCIYLSRRTDYSRSREGNGSYIGTYIEHGITIAQKQMQKLVVFNSTNWAIVGIDPHCL